METIKNIISLTFYLILLFTFVVLLFAFVVCVGYILINKHLFISLLKGMFIYFLFVIPIISMSVFNRESENGKHVWTNIENVNCIVFVVMVLAIVIKDFFIEINIDNYINDYLSIFKVIN